jgi:ABC-type transporter Mla subunit MlaD
MRKLILALIVIVGLAAICSLFVNRVHYSRQDLKSCFDDAGGLRASAVVRVAGVDVGTVRSIRANPQNKNCPAEVEMVLNTTYELRVPKDSIVEIKTAGLLGEVYLNIDTTQASAAPIENYGYLKSKPGKAMLSLADQLKAADVLLRLVGMIKEGEKETLKDPAVPTRP